MNYLKNTRLYMGGPIEFGDTSNNWRVEVKKTLIEKFNINLFDPFADEKQQWLPLLIQAKLDEDYDTITEICHNFVRKDLSLVDRSDFLIAYLPHKVPTTGTVHEIINSNNAKKPTLLVTDQKTIASIPAWYFGFIPKKCMFAGWNNLFNYLQEVDDGKHKDNNHWHYIYGLI